MTENGAKIGTLFLDAYVGTAICMENGSDEAKSAATYITDSNDEDGIAHAFEKYIF